MAHYDEGDTVRFSVERSATLNGHKLRTGTSVTVLLARDWNEEDGMGDDGAFGWGGYTAATLKRIAQEIRDGGDTDIVLWRR